MGHVKSSDCVSQQYSVKSFNIRSPIINIVPLRTKSYWAWPGAWQSHLLDLGQKRCWHQSIIVAIEMEHRDSAHSSAAHIDPVSVGMKQDLSVGIPSYTHHLVLLCQGQLSCLHIQTVDLNKKLVSSVSRLLYRPEGNSPAHRPPEPVPFLQWWPCV